MKISWKSIVSIILVVVLMVQLLPVSAFATDDDIIIIDEEDAPWDEWVDTPEDEPMDEDEIAVIDDATVTANESPAYVVGEVEELRGANEKHFRMSDGAFAALSYEEPVHFLDENGNWQEIDNTLRLEGKDYLAKAGKVEKRFAGSMDEEYLFQVSVDGYSLSMAAAEIRDIGAREAAEEAEEATEPEATLEPSLPPKESEAPIEPESTPELTIPPEETEETESVEEEPEEPVETDPGYEIIEIENTSAILVSNTAGDDDTEIITVVEEPEDYSESEEPEETPEDEEAEVIPTETEPEDDKVHMETEPADERSLEEAGFAALSESDVIADVEWTREEAPLYRRSVEQAANLERLSSQLSYRNVFPGVSYAYKNYGYTIKESIVIDAPQEDYNYAFLLKTENLKAALEEDGGISLFNEAGKEIMRIPAPYMFDADGAVSHDVHYTLKKYSDGYLLSVEADSAWINDAGRSFPVSIDPTVKQVTHTQNDGMSANVVSKTNPYQTGPNHTLNIGYAYDDINEQEYYSFVGFDSLPTIPKSCVVVNAVLQMTQSHYSGGEAYYGIYAVTDSRPSNTSSYADWINNHLCWNNKPAVSSTLADYAPASYQTTNHDLFWNITRIVKSWYEDSTSIRAFCIKRVTKTDADGSPVYAWASLLGYGGDNPCNAPYLYVYYRNATGLESYWSYHTQSLGDSGVGYVNDYTGNMVYVADLVSTSGLRMPASLELVYNAVDRQTENDYVNCGKGWKLNLQQKITPIPTTEEEYDIGFRYIYTDGDGTDHYLYQSSEGIVDEDGLGLTLTEYPSANSDLEKFELTSSSGSRMTFTQSGYLRRIYDADGNYIHMVFSDTYGGRITSVKDGAGRTITISYNSEGQISSITDPAGRSVSITYNENGRLKQITYPDLSNTIFYYISGRISQVTARNGAKIGYAYSSGGQVQTITEYGTDGSTGNSLELDYTKVGRTKFTDNQGRTEIYAFDYYGRTVNIRNSTGRAAMYGYTSGEDHGRKANSMTATSEAVAYVDNLLRNHSFETTIGTEWYYSSVSASTSVNYLGTRSAAISAGGYVAQNVPVQSGWITYMVSGYVKGTSTDSKVRLRVVSYDSNEAVLSTQDLTEFTLTTGWSRVFSKVVVPSDTAKFRVYFRNTGSDTIWVDCAQVEKGGVMNPYNLVQNGGFELTSADVWSFTNGQSGDGYVTGTSYGRSGRITGKPTNDALISQKIYINKPAKNLHFTISGLAYAQSVPLTIMKRQEDQLVRLRIEDRQFGLGIYSHFTNGTNKVEYVDFNDNISGIWQYISGTMGYSGNDASKTVDYIYVYCVYYKNSNKAYFDHIQLNIDETGVCYTYDEEGNLISAKDNTGRNQFFAYDNYHEMTSMTTPDNKNYTFTYSTTNPHQLLSATSTDAQQTYSFTYNSTGSMTSVKLQSTQEGKYIRQYTYYTNDGNYVTKAYDDRGYYVGYTYDSNKGTLSTVRDKRGSTTNYTYNANNDWITGASDTMGSVSYSYATRRLAQVTTPSTTYKFSYDVFGNPVSTKIGSRTLLTNSYAENNGNLTSKTYGNNTLTVNYEYDSYDRLTTMKYGSTTKATWAYTARGQVGTYYDAGEGKTWYYTYDDIGRLVRSDASDGSYFRTSYNVLDQNTSLHYKLETLGKRDVYYTYDDLNRPLEVKFGSGSAYKVTNAYDSLSRMSGRTYRITGSGYSNATVSYGYLDRSDANRTTTTVNSVSYTYTAGGKDLPNLQYSYDAAGNITEIKDDEEHTLEQYEYDKRNQLIRNNSATQNKTFTYTYDIAGNIRTRKTYAYTTGTLGTATATVNYGYTDSSWGDLLTSYNGNAITYDTIGNRKTYNGYTYTWQGRQLTKLSNGSNTYTYTYNADGIRTSKTVNDVTTTFYLNGTQILAQKKGDSDISWFFYDSTGTRVGMIRGNYVFYYIYNLQGDVVGIMNAATGKIVAKYSYDAWGNCTVENASGWTVGTNNPFRYRGYYYDTETGLYYVSSRYYDPEICRFINADDASNLGANSDFASVNLFAYCGNNPVNRADDGGEFWHIVVGAAIGGIIGAVSAAVSGGDAIDIAIGFLAGAGGGALAASGAGVFVQAVGSATIAMTSNAAQQANHIYISKKQESFDVGDMLIDGAVGLACGAWGGNGASYGNSDGIMAAGKQLFKRGFFDPQARSYYAKTAHRLGGDYVFKPLLESLGKSSVGTTVVTIKNIVRSYLE